jgi:hypothetical protein
MACSAPTEIVGGVTLSTSQFENAKALLQISGDQGDPTADGYDENIAGGNNAGGTTGVQIGNMPMQTTLPTPSPIPGTASNTTQPPNNPGTPLPGAIWNGSYDAAVSNNFKVRDFSINALFPNQLTSYDGTYTSDVRFTNLKALALNVAEPLLSKFGPFRINSAIRNTNSTSGLSQHVKGQAMDIQFVGWNYAKYWDNAAWVKENIPYDQFIYEHSDATGLVWYHLSFNNAGNRVPSLPTKVMTMYRNHYDPGLQRHG